MCNIVNLNIYMIILKDLKRLGTYCRVENLLIAKCNKHIKNLRSHCYKLQYICEKQLFHVNFFDIVYFL